jgi:hypothetical protein
MRPGRDTKSHCEFILEAGVPYLMSLLPLVKRAGGFESDVPSAHPACREQNQGRKVKSDRL